MKEREAELENYKNDREELIALRNHLYRLSDADLESAKESLDEMKTFISGRKIAIIGVHTNWINKLKKEFPQWKFLDANISRLNEATVLNGMERLYFFTNYLSHGTYGIYISKVREKNIPFGYLHSVNMDAVIRQIYEDLKI